MKKKIFAFTVVLFLLLSGVVVVAVEISDGMKSVDEDIESQVYQELKLNDRDNLTFDDTRDDDIREREKEIDEDRENDEDDVSSVLGELEKYNLTIEIEGEGSELEHGEGTHPFDDGDAVELDADPDPGWYFHGWTGDYEGTEEEITITMDEDKNITAHFEEKLDLTIAVEGEGDVDVDPDKEAYAGGTEVDLEAMPDEDWYFVNWTGDHEGEKKEITITMEEDKDITAHFEEKLELTIAVEGEGTVDVDPDKEAYAGGTEVDLEAMPDEGWYFVNWTGDHESEEEETTITMDEDKTVTVYFDNETYELRISHIGEGSTDPSQGVYNYRPGENVTIQATSEDGWYFDEWSGTEKTGDRITITMDEDMQIVAQFEGGDPIFDVEIISYEENVEKGDEIIVNYRVENSGGSDDVQDIVLEVDGEEMAVNSNLQLEAGKTYEGEFVLELDEEGDHHMEVRSTGDADGVMVSVEDESYEGILSNYWWLIIVLLIGVIAVGGCKVVMGNREEKTVSSQRQEQGLSTEGDTDTTSRMGKRSGWQDSEE